VGIDHYRTARIKDRYADMLIPAYAFGKPVVITEFGSRTYQGADTTTEGIAGDITDLRPNLPVIVSYLINKIITSLFDIQRPPPRMRLKKGNYIRDEDLQARELIDQINVLESAGVEGAFIMTFVSPVAPYNDNPQYDFDMNSYSLVKTLTGGKHGTTYPDMLWEPKKSFKAVGDYYAKH
jgi:hypothetical protein